MSINIVKTFHFNMATVIFSKDKNSMSFGVIPRQKVWWLECQEHKS